MIKKLEHLRLICDGATEGPWIKHPYDSRDILSTDGKKGYIVAIGLKPEDHLFILEARQYLPILLAVAEAASTLVMIPNGVPTHVQRSALVIALALLEE